MDVDLVAGRFRLPGGGRTPWWSDELYRVLGMSPGDVQPSLDALMHHVAVDQRETLRRALDACAQAAQPFAGVFGVRDLEGAVRTVAVAAVPAGPGPAEGHVVDGTVVDLTPQVLAAAAADVNDRLPAAVESRAAVEQAVGCLTLVYGVEREAALELLAWIAGEAGVDVTVAARRVMGAAVQVGGARGEDRRALDAAVESALEGCGIHLA